MAAPTATQRLAAFSSELRPEHLPAEVIENARWRLIDMVGVIIAGSRLESAGPISRVAGRMGGTEEATTLVFGQRLPAPLAGFVNGAVGHGPDYDDTHSRASVHISNVVVPAALAMGEARAASGRDLITAMVAGAEVGLRVGTAAPAHVFHSRGLHATAVCGPFGAAASAALLLGLDQVQTAQAIGMAASQASGLMQGLIDGSWVKRLQPGWSVQSGLTVALLAAEGFTGPDEALEGRYGLYSAYIFDRRQEVDLESALGSLGVRWLYPETIYKPYPNGAWNHSSMDAYVAIVRDHNLRHQEIDRVDCFVPPDCIPIVCEPREAKLNPTSGYHMKFSLPYSLAILAVLGHALVDDYSESVLADPAVAAFARRVHCAGDPALQAVGFPARVEVQTVTGERYTCDMPAQRGGLLNPMTELELSSKFRANVEPSLGAEPAARLLETLGKVWELESLSPIVEQCVG